MPQQGLSIVKAEPVDQAAPLSIVKAEPTAAQAAVPPPAPPSRWDQFVDAAKTAGHMLLNTSDLGASADTPKVVDTPTGLGMAGSALAGAAVTAAAPEAAGVAGLAGVARATPYIWRVGAGAARLAGAAIGGGAGAAAEGQPLTAPEGQPSISKAAAWQTALEAAGISGGWLFNAAGRRLLGSRVAQQAVTYLKDSRLGHIEEAQRVLQAVQDAIDAHTAARAAAAKAVGRSQTALAAKAEQVAGAWPQSEAAIQPPPATPAPAPATTAAGGPPPGRLTLPKPSPALQQYLNGKLDARDAALGLEPVTPPVRATGPVSRPDLPPRPPGPWDANAGIPPMAPVPAHAATPPPTSAAAPPPAPNFPADAARKVAKVVQGPAMASKRLIGQAVEDAAQSGPPIPTAALRTRLAELSDQATPSVLQPNAASQLSTSSGMSLDQAKAVLARNPDISEALGQIPPELHLPAALSYANDVVSTGDTIPFADAHKIKRILDGVVRWDRSARTLRESATKGFRQTLRSTMAAAGHTPYEQANAAYAAVSKLFAPNQLGSQISELVQKGNPERVVNSLVKPTEPTKFQMLKEVLLHHGEQGGGAAGKLSGQQAWESLQSTVMYKHLIQPGIENFDKSVARMHPEFLRLLTDSPTAQQVYGRLQTINAAYTAAQQEAAAITARAAEARTAAAGVKVGLQRQQRLAARGVEEARRSPVVPQPGEDRIGRILTEQERAFERSSLGKPNASPGQQLSDLAYATTAPPGSPRQIAGAFRLLARGPKTNDLIYWASLSDENTQQLVRAISSPRAADYVAALSRGVEQLIQQHGQKGPAGTPPPGAGLLITGHQPGAAAVPPPGPGR